MDAIRGFTRLEIINNVLDSVGRTGDATLQARLANDINTAQLSFWKMFDWKFGRISGGNLNGNYSIITNNNSEYQTTNVNVSGNTISMRATDIDRVYISYNPFNTSDTSYIPYARILTKIESRDAILADPGFQMGGVPLYWYISNSEAIEVLPYPNTALGTPAGLIGQYIWFDGKRQPIFMSNDSDYPDVPTECQETFTQYLLYRTLSRERDPRQAEELAIFEKMLKADKEADMAEIENNIHLRFPEEQISTTQYPGNFAAYKTFWDDF